MLVKRTVLKLVSIPAIPTVDIQWCFYWTRRLVCLFLSEKPCHHSFDGAPQSSSIGGINIGVLLAFDVEIVVVVVRGQNIIRWSDHGRRSVVLLAVVVFIFVIHRHC